MSETLPHVLFILVIVVRWGHALLQEMGSLKPMD